MDPHPIAGAARASGIGRASRDACNVDSQKIDTHSNRLTGIDAARGIAMVLVCLSHVRYAFAEISPPLYALLTNVTRLATPTFLLLSGFVAAYVLSGHKTETRISLIDRGLFVLVAGHLLLSWGDLRSVSVEDWMFARITVTDAIAICLIVAALATRLPALLLAIIGGALALASWPVALYWTPEAQTERYIAVMLFNVRSDATALTDAAVVPYLGLFLIGMSLSRWSMNELTSRRYAHAARRLIIVGAMAIAIVVLGVVSWLLMKRTLGLDAPEGALAFLRETLDPRHKLPPSPAYLMFYGGGGLLIAGICLFGRPTQLVQPIVRWTSTLGRASLMCFVVQDWLIVQLPTLFGFRFFASIPFWAAYLVAALLLLHALAARWDRARANRFLTVGLKRSYANRKRRQTLFAQEQARNALRYSR